MTIETAELVSRLNASRDSLKQLNIGEYTLIRSARDVMADAANALDAYDKTMQRIAEEPSALTHRQAAALIRSAPAPGREEIEDAVEGLVMELMQAVHVHYQADEDPDFGEYARDYTCAILALFHAPAEAGGGEAIGPFVTWAASVMEGEAENVGNGFAPFNDADEYVESITYGDLRLLAKAPSPTPPAGDGWEPIETAPKDGTWFIGLTSHGRVEPMRWISEDDDDGADGGGDDWGYANVRFTNVEHWRPLPPPPVSKGEKL